MFGENRKENGPLGSKGSPLLSPRKVESVKPPRTGSGKLSKPAPDQRSDRSFVPEEGTASKQDGEVIKLGLDPLRIYPYRDKIQREIDEKLLLFLLLKDLKTIELYFQYIFTRMYPSSPYPVCEGLKNSVSCWRCWVTFEEISYLVALMALLVKEVSRQHIAQAEKKEQDYHNQQFGKFTVIVYRLYRLITTPLACYERAEAEKKAEEAKISRGKGRGKVETLVDLTEDRGEAEGATELKDEEESRVETLVDGGEAEEGKVFEKDEEKSEVEVLVDLTEDEGEVEEAKVLRKDRLGSWWTWVTTQKKASLPEAWLWTWPVESNKNSP